MLKKRLIITLTFLDCVLFRTKKFKPDYRYTKNFIDLFSIDELILIDISKKKFSPNFLEIVNYFSKNCFVPICVGGGIKELTHADNYFQIGADKVLIGTSLINEKNVVGQMVNKYGSQAIIQSIDIKKKDRKYALYSNSGRKLEKIDPLTAIEEATNNKVGEILINNIDLDGSLLGYDIEIINKLKTKANCPLLALGGAGNWQHFTDLFFKTDISAVCTQNIFHFTEESIISAKKFLKNKKINIRI